MIGFTGIGDLPIRRLVTGTLLSSPENVIAAWNLP